MSLIQENFIKIDRQPQLLDVLLFPNKRLSEKSRIVTVSIPDNKDLQDLLADMTHTLKTYHAVGLAAIQVGVPLRVLVVQDATGTVHKIINPTVLTKSDDNIFDYEGCISVPGIYLRINRPSKVSVGYFDELGTYRVADHYDLLARAILHEMEHLDGKIYLDNLSRIERDKALKKARNVRRKFKT